MIRHSLILIAALSLGFAPAPVYRPKPETKPDDMKLLLGSWESVPPNGGVEISSGRIIYNRSNIYTLTLDPNARPPAYDLSGIAGGTAGRTFTGIYKLEGDTLTLCYNAGTANRPVAFGKGFNEVYKRKKR